MTKVLSDGKRIEDEIPARSYISSMEGGYQIMALEIAVSGNRQTIWKQDDAFSVTDATLNDGCGSRTSGLVGQQF